MANKTLLQSLVSAVILRADTWRATVSRRDPALMDRAFDRVVDTPRGFERSCKSSALVQRAESR